MCTWAGGARVTTGAAWVWARGANPRGQDRLVLHRGDRSRSGWHDRFSAGGCGKGALISTHPRQPLTASCTLVPSTHTALLSFSDTPGLQWWDQRYASLGWKPRALQGDKQAASSCGVQGKLCSAEPR